MTHDPAKVRELIEAATFVSGVFGPQFSTNCKCVDCTAGRRLQHAIAALDTTPQQEHERQGAEQ